MLRALLIDLDGTLVDTAPELALALNATLRASGREPVDEATVRGWIGDGARALLEKAFGGPVSEAVWQHFSLVYGEICGLHSTLFPGARELLQRLADDGVRLALLTNKEAAFAHRLLARHDIADLFDLLVAGDSLAVRKPDPAVAGHALAALDVPADEAALLGDSVTDVRTARAAGLRAWVVGHGYPAGEFAGADRPDAFVATLAELDPQALAGGADRQSIH
ncbi:HAD-IA family hydrolase [Rubrivivax gelatinosus]|uniref:phosphoglycolate phosphatase n=1 Tax=Rubrivivax gelatinosus TaxID=28068 RepID=A0ABS1DVJ2_RUBGE|nr:HAD-IA family hydrolase [Rubrivivax gelatinosus]MBK1713741.1 phosphoglycolate phosphatase [Rubrivivax gelatinosus]